MGIKETIKFYKTKLIYLLVLLNCNFRIKEDYQKVIIICPHPDDEIFGLGGSILMMINNGTKIHIVYCTDGENSEVWPDKEEIRYQRILLSEKACDYLKIPASEVTRLHLNDGYLPKPGQSGYDEIVRSVKEVIDSFKPDAVFATHQLDYWPSDHVACAYFACEAVKQSLSKPQLWYYWVWSWYNIRLKQLFNFKFKSLQKIDISDKLKRKKELMDIYLNSFTPTDIPWSGVLPQALLNALKFPIEVVERIL